MGSTVIIPDSMGSILSSIRAQMSAQATSPLLNHSTIQNGAVTVLDGSNEPRVVTGKYTFLAGNVHAGTTIYGSITLDESGNPIVVQGSQPGGWYGLGLYDTSGNLLVRLDPTGLHVYNATGTEEVRAGLLNASPAIYGLGVLPFGGAQLQQVGGVLSALPPDITNASTSTWTNFGSPSEVTCEVSPSGLVLVTVGGEITTSGANVEPFVGVQIDGGGTTHDLLAMSSAGGALNITGGAPLLFTGLSAGTHTFQLQYKVVNPGTANFLGLQMLIQPF